MSKFERWKVRQSDQFGDEPLLRRNACSRCKYLRGIPSKSGATFQVKVTSSDDGASVSFIAKGLVAAISYINEVLYLFELQF